MFKIEKLSKIYPGTDKGIRDLNLLLEPGDICAFIGLNGAGKTTSLKSIVGIHPFDEGVVELEGINLQENPQQYKSLMGYSPDTPDIYPNMTGKNYLELIGSMYEMDHNEMELQLNILLKQLDFKESVNDVISSYSHGMRQRLVLISLLMHNPKLIILDEPFVGLDPNATDFLKNEMKRRASEGVIIIYSTHVLEVAEKLCNRVVMIHKGRVAVNDSMENVTINKDLFSVFKDVTAHE